jgi:hypothetical protein
MSVRLEFCPTLLLVGLVYMPGFAFGIHIPLFVLLFKFDDDDDQGTLRPVEQT